MEQIKELTKAELNIMQIIWGGDGMFLAQIYEQIEEPRPAYTTVSTIVRILVKKEFISYKSYGKSNSYFPLVSKEEYANSAMNRMKMNFFGGSISNMLSFCAKREQLSKSEIEELRELLND